MGEILHAWKWVFPTSHDPQRLPLNYGCSFFLSKIVFWTWLNLLLQPGLLLLPILKARTLCVY